MDKKADGADLFSDKGSDEHFNARSKIAPLHGGPAAKQEHKVGLGLAAILGEETRR